MLVGLLKVSDSPIKKQCVDVLECEQHRPVAKNLSCAITTSLPALQMSTKLSMRIDTFVDQFPVVI
jgi:hypothetical protein